MANALQRAQSFGKSKEVQQALAGTDPKYASSVFYRAQTETDPAAKEYLQGLATQLRQSGIAPEIAGTTQDWRGQSHNLLKKIKPLKLLGSLAKGASKIAGIIPGVGTLAGAALGAGGELLSGGGLKGALRGAATGALPGVVRGVVGGAARSGLGGLVQKGVAALGGRGLPGSSGSLISQLATAVPGVIGAIQKGKQQGRQNRLLQTQSDAFGSIARTGQGLVDEAAPLRQGANAAIMSRLTGGPSSMDFATDRLNPFAHAFNPDVPPLPPRRRRPLLPPGAGSPAATPYLNAAVP